MYSEYDLMNGLTFEDAVWLKNHMPDADFFEPNALADVLQGYFKVISDVRENIDMS